jgi:glycosyltransferase involved in cell wall biosynthesis
MKILYITNARIPTEKAHGIQIIKTCEAFSSLVDNVELVIPRRMNYIKKSPFEYYEIKRNFKIIKLPCLDLIILDKYIGHLGMWIESLTFNLFALPYILFKKVDVIYTRDKLLIPFIWFKKNLIFEAHALPNNYFLYSLIFKKIKKIIVITEGLKDSFIKKGANGDKILVAPDGVDLEKFNISLRKEECRKKLNLPSDKKIVLYTGHLYKWKGVDILAKASRYLSNNIEIYFVGGTKKDIKNFKFKHSRFKSIKIVGHRSHSEIPYWLKAADVLVLPNSGKEEISREWTSPIKMFEYMASRTPIVASNLPSIREILNKNNAVLVNQNDEKDLAREIREIIENRDIAMILSRNAFENVKKYTWSRRANNILNFIKSDYYKY